MKTFNVYKHPDLGMEAVKVGFSWPGFFLGIFWLVYKSLWKYVGYIFAVYLVMTFLQNAIASSSLEPGLKDTYSLMVRIIHILILMMIGFKGNSWMETRFKERGYSPVSTVYAADPNRAMQTAQGLDAGQS